ncbi:MAG TPA: sialidase family protein [Hanamia sp.]|nr:sialidase family protein [Hanamia sp.]
MKPLGRRTFLKGSSQSGIAFLAGTRVFPENLFGIGGKNNNNTLIKSNGKICQVKKEVRIACPQLSLAPITGMNYIGQGMRREETLSFMQSSDWHIMNLSRGSEDNGHIWSAWVPVPTQTQTSGQYIQSGGASQRGDGQYDPVSGRLVKPVFQRIFQGSPEEALKTAWKGKRLFWDHGFYQLSKDNGKTWGEAFQLKYEESPDFDPSDWGKHEWLERNEMYIGNSIVLKNGSVIISATVPIPYKNEEDEKYPSIFPNNYREGCVAGAICFIGKWDDEIQNYRWEKSNSIFVPRQVSSRGLVELDVSELKNGNLLLIMRGSNTLKTPGRKWFSVSKDGGHTWNDITDIHYDTGEQLYSPASIDKTFRSSKTGKLYWIGNISSEPPNGDYPRYPLYIVEVDEDHPSFVKDSLTVIDNRDPKQDTKNVQLSNFALLEDRDTLNVEIYMTRLGENVDTYSANAYKYTLVF